MPSSLLQFAGKLFRPEDGIVERYLRERRVEVVELQDILQHPQALHPWSGTYWLCMAAAVRDVHGHLRSVHRTFLSTTNPPTKALIDPVRAVWRGIKVGGCAIHLASAALLLGEGIESTANAMRLLGLPAHGR